MMRSRFFIYIIVSVILIGSLVFFNARAPGQFLRMQIFKGIRPAMISLHRFRVWNSSAFLQMENDGETGVDTKEKLIAAKAEIETLIEENSRLRFAFGFKEKNKIDLKGASVVYHGREFGKEYLLIDRGTDEEIKKGDSVVDANGLLIGRIADGENLFAKVSIASNTEEVFDVELLPLGVKAFAKGLGGRAFSLELIAQNAVIRRGDHIMAKIGQFSFLLGEVVRMETNGTGAFKEVRGVLLSHPDWEGEVFVVSGM